MRRGGAAAEYALCGEQGLGAEELAEVESGQARGGRVDAHGTTLTPILGPVLNGIGFANISDTDNGAYDGDTTTGPSDPCSSSPPPGRDGARAPTATP